jgi:hypothetical protein
MGAHLIHQSGLALIAGDDAAAILEYVDFHLIAGPGDAIAQSRVKHMHPLVPGGYRGVGIVQGQGFHIGAVHQNV